MVKVAKVAGLMRLPNEGYAKVFTLDGIGVEPVVVKVGLMELKKLDIRVFDTVELEYKEHLETPIIRRVILEDRQIRASLNRML